MRPVILPSLLASIALTGCIVPGPGQGDDVNDLDPTTTPPAPVASGAYQVTSNIDITIEALLPEPAANFVATLRDFSTAPAHTLITVAGEAGVPAVGTLQSALPDALESRLEGWLDEEIAKMTINGLPVTTVAGNIAALAETALTQISIESELTIANGAATHRLVTLDLAPTGIDMQLALGAFPTDLVFTTASATSTRGTLALGDHGFAFAYGEYAWQAINAQFSAEFGGDVRATLGAAVNCPLVAARVAAKCVWSVCVGHATELTSICERGLDEVVDRVHDKFASYRFDALHFAAGTATITSTGLTAGVWDAEINAGQGLRHVPATFTAAR